MIRYVFTVITKAKFLPDNPLEQHAWLKTMVEQLTKLVDAEQVGIAAFIEQKENDNHNG